MEVRGYLLPVLMLHRTPMQVHGYVFPVLLLHRTPVSQGILTSSFIIIYIFFLFLFQVICLLQTTIFKVLFVKMHFNVVSVRHGLYRGLTLTLVREQRFVRIIITIILMALTQTDIYYSLFMRVHRQTPNARSHAHICIHVNVRVCIVTV